MNHVQSGEISVDVEGHQLNGYLARPAQPGPGMLVLHAWWGLNTFFKQLCDRLAAEGFVAFAPDLMAGKVAATVAEAETLMRSRDEDTVGAAALRGLAFLRQQQPHPAAPIGVIGFSMGAAWALVLAAEQPDAVKSVTLFYGAYPGLDYTKMRAAVQGHFAQVDEWEPEEGVTQMENEMRSAGLQVELHRYPGAGHWFFESDRPDAYNPEVAAQAWERAIRFLKQ